MSRRRGYREIVADYLAAGRHLLTQREAKPIPQIAAELGTTPQTVRRWLRRDHAELWLHHWPTFAELWDELEQERLGRPPCEQALLDLPDPAEARFGEDLWSR